MSLEVHTKDGVVILTPRGMLLGGKETEDLQNKIVALDGTGSQRLLINLGKTTYMSSMGLAALFLARAKYVKRGAVVKLCCVDRKIMQLFIVVRLVLVYGDDIHLTEEEALAAFAAMGAGAPRG
jgi:anti-anti-sigma factor